ncbi:MAG: hypothetical protein AAF205_10635, partial [Pseudomonadota bacterium]
MPHALLFLVWLIAGSVQVQAQPRAPFASFDGEDLTMTSGTRLRRARLADVLRGRAKWRTVYDAGPAMIRRADCLPPGFEICLLALEQAGNDGTAIREVDLASGTDVVGGFQMSSGPNRVAWYDGRHVMLAGDTGPGSLSDDREPRFVKLWRRGTAPVEASTILALESGTTGLTPIFDVSTGGLFHAATFRDDAGADALYHFGWQQNFTPSRLPGTFTFQTFFQGRTIALLGATWNGIPAGGLAAYPMAPLLGPARRT